MLQKEIVEDMYINQNLSIQKMRKILKCSDRTLTKFMIENNIPIKTKDNSILSKEQQTNIVSLYFDGKNPREISELLNISQSKIKSFLLKENIWQSKEKINEKEIVDLYTKNQLTIRQIAKLKNCSLKKVQLAIEKYNIQKNNLEYKFNKQELMLLYLKYHMSISKIAKLKNTTPYYVKKAICKFNLK